MKALSDRDLIDFCSLSTNKQNRKHKQTNKTQRQNKKKFYNSGVCGKSFHLAQIVNLSKFSVLPIFLNSWM